MDKKTKLYSEYNYLKRIKNRLSEEDKEKCISIEDHRSILENKLIELMRKTNFK